MILVQFVSSLIIPAFDKVHLQYNDEYQFFQAGLVRYSGDRLYRQIELLYVRRRNGDHLTIMKAILTGMNGTVAPALARYLSNAGFEISAWDRKLIPTEDHARNEAFILSEKPDWFFQIATGSPDWMASTAAICKQHGIKFLFTGSVSVFDGGKSGPFSIDHIPDATDDYGRYKADCERRIVAVNPDAIIARLGWQIGDAPGNNNMVDFLTRTQKEKGQIEASAGWIPSTAYLSDSVEALYKLMTDHPAGLYQLEGNPGFSFYQIVSALNERFQRPWKVVRKDEPRRDIRMLDDRIAMGKLDQHLSIAVNETT